MSMERRVLIGLGTVIAGAALINALVQNTGRATTTPRQYSDRYIGLIAKANGTEANLRDCEESYGQGSRKCDSAYSDYTAAANAVMDGWMDRYDGDPVDPEDRSK